MRALLHLPLVAVFMASGLQPAFAQIGIRWSGDLQNAQQTAQRDGRLLLIHFYTDWCGPCRRLEQEVFPRDDVARVIANSYVPVKLNAERAKDAAAFYAVDRYPTDIIADSGGRVLLRTVTPQDPAKYIQLLESVAAQHRNMAPNFQAAAQPAVENGGTQGMTPGGGASVWNDQYVGQAPQDWQSGWAQPGPTPPPSQGTPGIRRQPDWQQPWGTQASSNPPPTPQPGQNPNAFAQNRYYGQTDLQSGQNGSQYPSQPSPYGPRYADQYPGPQGQNPPLTAPNSGGFQQNPYTVTNQNAGVPVENFAQQGWGQTNPYAPGPGTQSQGDLTTRDPRGMNQAAVAATTAPELPVALDGYCPVTLAEREEWTPGDPQWGMMHRGRSYRFASYDGMQKFRADPDRYSPVMSGFDVVRYVDSAEVATGKRRHGMWFHGKMYLFSDEASLDRFSRSPVYYEQRAYEIMVNGRR